MLAGKMKLNHFLIIATAIGLAGIVGLYFACGNGEDDDGKKVAAPAADQPTKDRTATPAPQPRPQPIHGGQDTPPPAETPSTRDVDRVLFGWAGKDLGSKKKKDVTKGRPYKINLYQDDGKSSVNRAKVDLDRDDKWDEKWTFDGTSISRKVAPADDESYSERYVWNGEDWVAE